MQENNTYATFIDIYTHADAQGNIAHEVLRFGINSAILDAKTINSATGSPAQKLPDISAKGSNSSSTGPAISIAAHRAEAQKQITRYEKDVVIKAIAHLSVPGQTAKTALVDIFERDANGNIATAKDTSGAVIMTATGAPKPATHTVVLFAQNGKYLVIDPSNASFSHILSGASDDIRLCFNKKFQVYSKPQGAITGPNKDQWRDCIDVATKLAFNIEMNAKLGMFNISVKEDAASNSGEIDFVSLRDSAPIKEVTNNADTIYTKLSKKIGEDPTRLKQSSDVKVEKGVTACLTTVSQIFTASAEKLTMLGLYHLQTNKLKPIIHDFYNAASVETDYTAFRTKVISLLSDSQNVVHDAESVGLLALELDYIDKL